MDNQKELSEEVTRISDLSDTALSGLAVNERINLFVNICWGSRNIAYVKAPEAEALIQNVNTQALRILRTLPQEVFQSPELIEAAQSVSATLQNIKQHDASKFQNWTNLLLSEKEAILSRINVAQAKALNFKPSTVLYTPSKDISYGFIRGSLPPERFEDDPYSVLRINALGDFSSTRSAREDIETVLMLGMRKFVYTHLSRDKKAEGVSSPQHTALLDLAMANVALAGQAIKFENYPDERSLPINSITAHFINNAFGGENPVFPKLAAVEQGKETYCSIDGLSGYAAFFKSRFYDEGAAGIATAPAEVRRIILREFYRDAQDEVMGTFPGNRSPKFSREKLSKIFAAIPFQEEYQRYYQEKAEDFAKQLASDRVVKAANHLWTFLPLFAKRIIIGYIAKRQDKAFDHPSFSFSATPKFHFISAYGSYDALHDDKGHITFNMQAEGWRSLKGTVNNLGHEKTHDQQMQITRASMAGQLTVGSPFYWQAQDFEDFFGSKPGDDKSAAGGSIYIQAHEHMNAYWNHPIERQAREIAEIITSLIKPGFFEKRPLQKKDTVQISRKSITSQTKGM